MVEAPPRDPSLVPESRRICEAEARLALPFLGSAGLLRQSSDYRKTGHPLLPKPGQAGLQGLQRLNGYQSAHPAVRPASLHAVILPAPTRTRRNKHPCGTPRGRVVLVYLSPATVPGGPDKDHSSEADMVFASCPGSLEHLGCGFECGHDSPSTDHTSSACATAKAFFLTSQSGRTSPSIRQKAGEWLCSLRWIISCAIT